MKLEDFNLEKQLEFQVDKGQIMLGDDRMLLFRQDALLELRKLLFTQLSGKLTRAIISQFGYRCGIGDYKTLNEIYTWDTDMDRIASGPTMHTWEGIVHVEPTFLEFDFDSGHFHMKGIWRNSYEADIHMREYGLEKHPVCYSLTGYASGWCTGFMGSEMLAIETKCVGKGDEYCEFEIKPPDKWGPEADSYKEFLDSTSMSISKELEENLHLVKQQQEAIRELSTPIMEIWDDVLCLPVVGIVDTRRSVEIMDSLLEKIVESQSRCVIIDITGVEIVDTKTADYLLKVVQASQLLGARCVLTGINPAVAQTLVEIGADLSQVSTLRNLKAGLVDCIKYIRQNSASQENQ
jgi:rsbT co-antagonist protein RsbR